MPCPTENVLLGLLDGCAEGDSRAQLTDHLADCDHCSETIAGFARLATWQPFTLGPSGTATGSTQVSTDAAAEDTAAELPPGTRLGRYVVQHRIGVGGAGEVYAGFDPELDRQVALKVLRRRVSEEADQVSLLAEARAAAQLAHPNVIRVYDAGTHTGRAYLAMELVEGVSLVQWLQLHRPGWKLVVKQFLQAGRGLAAAHDAGLAHRDFKPGNVLIGDDGIGRVGDFGIACSITAPADHTAPAHRLQGTPAYMAPEQFRTEPADERTDQFAFCVALFEALYGHRPFAGATVTELAAAVIAGDQLPAPASSRVPTWLHQAVARGLAREQNDRHCSMHALLDILEQTPRRRHRRRTAALVMSAALAMALAAVALWPGQQEDLCPVPRAKLADAWGARQDTALRTALVDADPVDGQQTHQQVSAAMSRYSEQWADSYVAACRDTRVYERQSLAVMQERVRCLELRRLEFAALVRLLITADGPTLARATEVSLGLPELASCNDAALRSATAAPPAPTQQAAVHAVEQRIASARALVSLADYERATPVVTAIVKEATATGYRRVQAAALLLAGRTAVGAGHTADGRSLLERAVWAAEAAGDDAIKVGAATQLVRAYGENGVDFRRAHDWAELATATCERLPGRLDLQADVATARAGLAMRQGHYADARASFAAALALRQQLAPTDLKTAKAHGNLAYALRKLGRFDEAHQQLSSSLELKRELLGSEHPSYAVGLMSLASLALELDKPEDARTHAIGALAICERKLGPAHPRAAIALTTLGRAEARLGQLDQAIAHYERALAIYDLTDDQSRQADVLNNLALAVAEAGDPARAGDLHQRAYDLRRTLLGPNHLATGLSAVSLGNLAADAGDCRAALPRYDEALAIFDSIDPQHRRVALALTGLGACQLALGHPSQALPALERALALQADDATVRPAAARAELNLAQALWDSGESRERAVTVAKHTRDRCARHNSECEADAAAWLAGHHHPLPANTAR